MTQLFPVVPNKTSDIVLKDKSLFKTDRYYYHDNIFYTINDDNMSVTVIDQTNEPITYQITIDEFNKIKKQTQLKDLILLMKQ